jgi:hypothetical protein
MLYKDHYYSILGGVGGLPVSTPIRRQDNQWLDGLSTGYVQRKVGYDLVIRRAFGKKQVVSGSDSHIIAYFNRIGQKE